MLAHVLQLAQKLRKLRGVDRRLQIEVEPEGIVGTGDRAALQLREVDAVAVDAGQDLIEAARLVGEREQQARPVCARINFRLRRDADEAGIVAAVILHARLQDLQAVDLRAGVRGDGGQILPAGLGDHAGRFGGIGTARDGHARQRPQQLRTLAQRLLV